MNEETPRTVKIQTLAIVIMTVIALLSGFFVLRWSYQSSKVLVVNNSPVPVKPPEVIPEGKIFLDIDFCKYNDLTDKTAVTLVGEHGANIAVNWPSGKAPPQCTVLKDVPLPIPAQTPTDTYYAKFEVCYNINYLKKNRCTTFTSQSFKVINSKLSPGDAKAQGVM